MENGAAPAKLARSNDVGEVRSGVDEVSMGGKAAAPTVLLK